MPAKPRSDSRRRAKKKAPFSDLQITELLQPGGGVVCDLDGVLYRGDVPIEGAAEAVERLRAAGLSLLFCTNNSHPTRAAYARKLGAMGIDIEPRQLP